MRLQPGADFAGYTIQRLLGVGGMGAVYLARHPRLDRLVALKVLSEAFGDNASVRTRFEREAALASRLDHPNIVPVYDRSGQDSEILWLSMKFVPGGDTTELLADAGTLPAARAVGLIADAARALDYAHRHGVLHRDVKPANLLVESDGDGAERALLTDFGIARMLDAADTLSGLTASIAYTAPERFRGEPADHRSDIYSLGCTLYQLLCGRTPFPFDSQAAVVGAHLTAPPPRPNDLHPGLPTGLNTVIATALAKNPGERYPTCLALAAAAEQVLAEAQRETVVRQPDRRQIRTGPAQPPTRPQPSSAGRGAFGAAPGRTPTASGRGLNWPGLGSARGDAVPELLSSNGNAWSLAFSPDGSLLAVTTSENSVTLFDVRHRRPVGPALRGHDEPIAAVAFSPDGSLIATASWDKTAQLWDVRTRRPTGAPLRGHTEWVKTVAFSPDGTLLATGGNDRTIRIWHTRTRRPVVPPLDFEDSVYSAGFSPDGRLLAAGGIGFRIRLWQAPAFQPAAHPDLEVPIHLHNLAFSPDGTQLAAGIWQSSVYLWDVATRTRTAELQGHTDWVRAVAFTPDGALLATGSDDQTVRLWNPHTHRSVGDPLRAQVGNIQSIDISPDGTLLALGGDAVRLWPLRSPA